MEDDDMWIDISSQDNASTPSGSQSNTPPASTSPSDNINQSYNIVDIMAGSASGNGRQKTDGNGQKVKNNPKKAGDSKALEGSPSKPKTNPKNLEGDQKKAGDSKTLEGSPSKPKSNPKNVEGDLKKSNGTYRSSSIFVPPPSGPALRYTGDNSSILALNLNPGPVPIPEDMSDAIDKISKRGLENASDPNGPRDPPFPDQPSLKAFKNTHAHEPTTDTDLVKTIVNEFEEIVRVQGVRTLTRAAKVQDLKMEIDLLKQKLADCEAHRKASDDKGKEKENPDLQARDHEIDSLKKQLADCEGHGKDLQKKCDDLVAEALEQHSKSEDLKRLNDKIKSLKEQLTLCQTHGEDLKDQLADSEAKLKKANERIAQLEADEKALKKNLDDLKAAAENGGISKDDKGNSKQTPTADAKTIRELINIVRGTSAVATLMRSKCALNNNNGQVAIRYAEKAYAEFDDIPNHELDAARAVFWVGVGEASMEHWEQALREFQRAEKLLKPHPKCGESKSVHAWIAKCKTQISKV